MTATEVQLTISIATIVTTIFGSGVVSAIVAHKLSSAKAEREFKRKKLEELYVAVHRYCSKLFTANLIWQRVMRREIDENQALDFFIKNNSEKDYSYENAEMIINIYFRQLLPILNIIIQRRERINKIVSDFKKVYRRGEPCDSFVQPFVDELTAIDVDEKKFKDELFRISKSLK